MKTSKYFSIIFLFITFSLSIGIFINGINAYIKSKEFKDNFMNSKKYSNFVNWKKEYPLDDKKEVEEKNSNKFQLIYYKIKNNISKIDNFSKNNLTLRIKFIEFGYHINEIIGKNLFLEKDNLIRFDNGYWGYICSEKDSFEEDGKKTVEFVNYLKSQNIKFAYVLCPSKFSKFKKELPLGMVDYTNENADSFLKVLYDNNINVLDLREDLNKEFPNHFDTFFKTDHHWKPETGFWATQKLINFLNKKLGLNLEDGIIKKENFNFKTYHKLFLGSQGKKVTLSLAEPEDLSVITPKFNTDFKFEVYCTDIKKEGNFEISLLSSNFLLKDYYEINNYHAYLGTINPFTRIHNNLTTNSNKILIIKNSFIQVVAPFLSCVTNEIVLVEIRKSQPHFDGSIKKLIEKEKPDIVMIIYSCHAFNPSDKDRLYLHKFD